MYITCGGTKANSHLFSSYSLFQTLLASLLVLLPLLEKGFWDLNILLKRIFSRIPDKQLDVPTETVGTLYSQQVSCQYSPWHKKTTNLRG